MLKLTVQIKALAANPQHTWDDKLKALAECAGFIQLLNESEAFKPYLVHGPLASNPVSPNVEGYLGTVNGIPNQAGVCEVVIDNYDALKIVAWPPEAPFFPYFGDSSERIPSLDEQGNPVLDEKGEPVYETVLAGAIVE